MPENTLLFHIQEPYPTNPQTLNPLMQVYLYQFSKANGYPYGDYVYSHVCPILTPIANGTLQMNEM